MAAYADSVNGDTSVVSDTVIDARKSASGCEKVSLQAMTVKLSADLVIYADGFQSVNGLKVNSADGRPHSLRIIVPGESSTCTSGKGIALSAGTVVDPLITSFLHAPSKVSIAGPSAFSGTIEAGCVQSNGAVTITSAETHHD
jgi:hypothetical protein